MVVLESRDLAARLSNLERANEVRLARTRLKQAVREGRVSVAQVLLDPPECVLSMRVDALLLAQFRWGRVRCGHVLRSASVGVLVTVGGLTDRQRRALVVALEGTAGS